MEALLLEMRNEEDVKLKRLVEIQRQLDGLTAIVKTNSNKIESLRKRRT